MKKFFWFLIPHNHSIPEDNSIHLFGTCTKCGRDFILPYPDGDKIYQQIPSKHTAQMYSIFLYGSAVFVGILIAFVLTK